jgi:uncharacterized damage-inducible protein DinB
MKRIDSLVAEFVQETGTTRKHLARLPTAQWEWRPHVKSFTVGQLASHLVDCIRWVEPIFAADELDMDPRAYTPFSAESLTALLATYDSGVAKAKQTMEKSTDTSCRRSWRLKMNGKVWFEKPREAVFRDMALSHLVHHRGQLSVYLRMLDVPVPGSYGPTADEKMA